MGIDAANVHTVTSRYNIDTVEPNQDSLNLQIR